MKCSLYCHFLATLVLSTVYFIVPNAGTKILPVMALCIFAFLEGNRYSKYVAIGLIFSAIGDVSLELEDGNFLIFLCGVVSFLIAHCFYIRAYISSNIDYEYKIACGVAFVTYYCILMGILIPFTDAIMIPAILIYGGVIATMACLATNRYFTLEIGATSRTTALVGSIFFLASDTTLSINLFRTSVPHSNVIIMVTYYIGQMFIAMSAKDPYREGYEGDAATPLIA